MRIDCFLVSKTLAYLVSEVKVFGSGADRKGFIGSDHSPLLLGLRDAARALASNGEISHVADGGEGEGKGDRKVEETECSGGQEMPMGEHERDSSADGTS